MSCVGVPDTRRPSLGVDILTMSKVPAADRGEARGCQILASNALQRDFSFITGRYLSRHSVSLYGISSVFKC